MTVQARLLGDSSIRLWSLSAQQRLRRQISGLEAVTEAPCEADRVLNYYGLSLGLYLMILLAMTPLTYAQISNN